MIYRLFRIQIPACAGMDPRLTGKGVAVFWVQPPLRKHPKLSPDERA